MARKIPTPDELGKELKTFQNCMYTALIDVAFVIVGSFLHRLTGSSFFIYGGFICCAATEITLMILVTAQTG